jgi:UDPglucose 6-dehydrogenase
MRVGIIGYGWVGRAMKQLFPQAWVYDLINIDGLTNPESTPFTTSKLIFNSECDIAFVCVPTPNIGEGKLDISIVEEVVSWCQSKLIVLRSTVNPGDTIRLMEKYNKAIIVQPEYLGETVAHPLLDQKSRPFIVIGSNDSVARKMLIDLYMSVYNANVNIRQVTPYEAEVIKLTENRAIAFKVAQCQELYDVCQKVGVDYYTIREVVYGDDPRFNLWFTAVYPDNRGLNSKCIPKDVYAWAAWAESTGYKPQITRALLEKNKQWIT